MTVACKTTTILLKCWVICGSYIHHEVPWVHAVSVEILEEMYDILVGGWAYPSEKWWSESQWWWNSQLFMEQKSCWSTFTLIVGLIIHGASGIGYGTWKIS